MKNKIFILLFVALATPVFGQEKEDKTVITTPIEIQTGLLGIWANKEYKLSNELQ